LPHYIKLTLTPADLHIVQGLMAEYKLDSQATAVLTHLRGGIAIRHPISPIIGEILRYWQRIMKKRIDRPGTAEAEKNAVVEVFLQQEMR